MHNTWLSSGGGSLRRRRLQGVEPATQNGLLKESRRGPKNSINHSVYTRHRHTILFFPSLKSPAAHTTHLVYDTLACLNERDASYHYVCIFFNLSHSFRLSITACYIAVSFLLSVFGHSIHRRAYNRFLPFQKSLHITVHNAIRLNTGLYLLFVPKPSLYPFSLYQN